MSVPPPRRATFATPRAVDGPSGVDGVIYVVCESGFGSYTCAFGVGDGELRWWTPTDARVSGGHFMDWAVPLVRDGVVFSGTYALSERDGSVLWRIGIDTLEEGTLALHALANQTLYASTQRGIYATNAQDGQVHWRYRAPESRYFSGPPVVSDRLLYLGISGGGGYPPTGHCIALDVQTGAEVWRYPMGSYIGAVVQQESIYVSSGDRFVYALDAKSGALRWRQPPSAVGHHLRDPACVADGVLYIAADGVYALRQESGEVLWHQPLVSSPSVSFTRPAVLDSAVYVTCIGRHLQGALYALDRHTAATYWRAPFHSATAVAVAQ